MDEYLISFKQRMLSAQKGDETISLEQARRDFSNLLNFDFGDANYPTNVFQHDTLYVKLTKTNGMVDLSQLALTYNNAVDQIIASYQVVDLPEKSVYAIYCEYNDTDNKDGDTEEVRIIVNYRGLRSGIIFMHDTLSWHPRDMDGCCDDPSILYGGPVNMSHWLLTSQQQLECPNGGRLYYTDDHNWEKDGYNTYDPIEGRYKIFCMYTNQIDTVCISHEDMEYYYANILNYFDQETTGYKTMITVHTVCCYSYDHLPNGSHHKYYYWNVHIYYGKPNCTGSDPLL